MKHGLRDVIPEEEIEQEKEFEKDQDLIHVIYENGDFRPDLGVEMRRWELYNNGFDYHVLAVLGAQSSGKSTLLNGLFGTTFPTLQAQSGRFQCTKGIWMGRSADSPIVVLDVEGVDGRERGDEDRAFERKTSLFSLVLAQTLIINLWHHDIGRYSAANLELLRTVMRLNLLLFQSEKRSKTLLLFVIRDHIPEQTPLSALQQQLRESLDEIWKGLEKPASYASSSITDFFEFDYVALASKFQPDKFEVHIKDLKDRFINPENPKYIWASSHMRTDIPADGLAPYASRIWDVVKANRDLDLPSQKEMLALFRCGEIASGALEEFTAGLAPLEEQLRKGALPEGFGASSGQLLTALKATFDGPASNYDAKFAGEKRAEMMESALKDLKELYLLFTSLLRVQALKSFRERMQAAFGDPKSTFPGFASTVDEIREHALKMFDEGAAEATPEDREWSSDADREQLLASIKETVAQEKEKQLKRLLEDAKKKFDSFGVTIEHHLDEASDEMWSNIRADYVAAVEDSEGQMVTVLGAFDLTPEQLEELVAELREHHLTSMRLKMQEEGKQLSYRMETRFNDFFKYDDRRMPRDWAPDTPIDEIFSKAVGEARKLLDLFSVLRLREEDSHWSWYGEAADKRVPDELVVLTLSECKKTEAKFQHFADGACFQARRDQEHAGLRGNSFYIMLAICGLLGFNEAVWLLSNPFMLVFLTLAGAGGYAGWRLGLAPIVMPTVRLMIKQVLAVVGGVATGLAQPGQPGGPNKEKAD